MTLDPLSRSNDVRSGEAAGLPSTAPASPALSRPIEPLWGLALAAGLIAGLLTWITGEAAWRRVNAAATPKIVAFPTGEDRNRMIHDMARSTAVSFSQQAAILGAILGLTGGLARRRPVPGLIAALAGAALGALAAGVAARGLLPVYYRNVDPSLNDLTYPLLTHGGVWSAAGASAGLAFGLGLGGQGRWIRCAVGGLLGGVLATLFYDLVGAFAFPLDKTSQPVSPTLITRLFAQFSVAVFAALGAALAAAESAHRERPLS